MTKVIPVNEMVHDISYIFFLQTMKRVSPYISSEVCNQPIISRRSVATIQSFLQLTYLPHSTSKLRPILTVTMDFILLFSHTFSTNKSLISLRLPCGPWLPAFPPTIEQGRLEDENRFLRDLYESSTKEHLPSQTSMAYVPCDLFKEVVINIFIQNGGIPSHKILRHKSINARHHNIQQQCKRQIACLSFFKSEAKCDNFECCMKRKHLFSH